MNLSATAENILLASWSNGTKKQYGSYARKWLKYCSENHIDCCRASVTEIIEFLTDMFKNSNVQYSTFNTVRSMLSSMVEPRDGITVGNHPLVKRFMKGIFKLRPSLPKYTVTYNAQIVLQHMTRMPPLAQLTLPEVTKKLATLMALLSGQRAQTLYALDITYMHITPERVIFYISELLKTSRPSFHQQPLNLTAYPQDGKLCVVQTLKEYLKQTKPIRGGCTRLFISVSKPHHPVTTGTIARWIKEILNNSGIDTTNFTAHSTRVASTSLAKSRGLSVTEIAKAAGWSNCSTFAKHYDKPIMDKGFSSTITH